MTGSSTAADHEPWNKLDTSVPHSARIWNYWLRGKDNYAVDRAAGDKFREVFPQIVDIARESRAFLVRAVTYLAGVAGVRQFLDVGTGLPAADNTHQVAQRVAPGSRIVYVDNDPLVLVHARALLVGTPQDSVDYVDADVREPDRILDYAAQTLDLTQPTALMLMGILGHVPDDEQACSIVRRLMAGLASGSYLAHYDGTTLDRRRVEATRQYNETGAAPYQLRDPATTARFFDGLEVVEPGLVDVTRWRPVASRHATVCQVCGVGRKP